MFTSVHLQTSIWVFFPHKHIHTESQWIISCSLVPAAFCYNKTKRQPVSIAYSRRFEKEPYEIVKHSADTVRIIQSDRQGVFLLAVSPNLSLNKTLNWQDEEQKRVKYSKCIFLVFSTLLPSLEHCVSWCSVLIIACVRQLN